MPPVGHTTPDTVDGDAQTLSCSPTRSGSAEVQCSATSVPFSLHVRENQTYIHRDEHPRFLIKIHNAQPIARLETDQHDQHDQQSHQQTIHPTQQSNHTRCHRDHRTPHRLLRNNTRDHHLQHQRTRDTSTINPIPQRLPKLHLGRCDPWRLRNPLQPARSIQLGPNHRRP